MNGRQWVGLVVLALAGWLTVALLHEPEPAAPLVNFDSSARCATCHAEVYAEWKDSWHSRSWNDPDVRALSNDFANTDCIACHAPRPVLSTGIGNRVLPRSARREEGVDCIACHLVMDTGPGGTGEPGVAGTVDRPGAACRPRAVLDLQRPGFCGACHDQHRTVRQWEASVWAEKGVSCIDCHMPYRDGDPNRGRDHRCRGGHDLELVKSAVEMRGGREGDGWTIEVENVGAGHHFPTDERSRAVDIFWRPLALGAESGSGPWRHLYRFRDPYRHETDIPATHLASGETRRVALVDDGAVAGAEVGLFYKLTPYYADPAQPDPEVEARLVQRLLLRP